ncbi:putative membrane protein [Rhodococcus sp. LBL1]|nr:putative membrane protein [Rhodococcus sp. LBL1]MDH6683832.1 putative membrane protein [Rhodococcus sp. LBL2]
MGPTTFNGMPIHPLLVHFVAVLVPTSALLVLLSVCWPAARRRIGVIAPVVALITLILVPLTTHAGEWLEKQTPRDPLVRIHAELGDQLLFWSAGVFVVSAVWWAIHDSRVRGWWESRGGSTRGQAPRVLTIALTVVAIAVSVGSVVQVYRIGESGAAAVWSGSDGADEAPTASQ